MTEKIESLRRAANSEIERLIHLVNEIPQRGSDRIHVSRNMERKNALSEARTVQIIAKALAGAAEAAIEAFKDPPPPDIHHHTHQAPSPISPIGGVVGAEMNRNA